MIMLAKVLLIALACTSMATAADTLLKVIEFVTPGSHAPEQIFDFAAKKEDNFKVPGELTPLGIRQQYLLGEELRFRYTQDNALFSPDYYIHDHWLLSA